jgi:SAM-dependent methyltransferase
MIARRKLPEAYLRWNRRHGAPFGKTPGLRRSIEARLPLELRVMLFGPFSVQTNNTLRAFEYPWAFSAGELQKGLSVLEIGGGLSGFQFVLDRLGCRVVNVDPGMEARGRGWPCDAATFRRLNRALGTSVELRNTTVTGAELEPEAYDRAFAISVLEHLPAEEIEQACRAVYRSLRPGGRFVMTTDLFLDTVPFSDRSDNVYGKNVSLAWLAGLAPFRLETGEKSELYGFDEFDHKRVMANLGDYLIGSYPVLAQCVVLVKPQGAARSPGG